MNQFLASILRPQPSVLCLVFLCAPLPALGAQDSVIVINPDAPASESLGAPGLPAEVLNEALTTYNDSGTIRIPGGLVLPPGARLEGRVAVYRGAVRLAGVLEGSLTVINGDLLIQPSGEVQGDILIVGGRLTVEPGGVHQGTARVYWEAVPLTRAADGTLLRRVEGPRLPQLGAARASFQSGRFHTTLLLATDQTYNRIEGLPVRFGPTVEWRASDQLAASLQAHGVLRTAGGSSSPRHQLGYSIHSDWRFGKSGGFGIGGSLYNQVTGIEEHTNSRHEIGWSAFLLQRDNRDYFLAVGGGGQVYWYPAPGLRLEGSLRREQESSILGSDPWSLFRNADRWRANPLIDDGDYTALGLGLELDTRNQRGEPSSGWWLRARYEHAMSGDVAPIGLPTAVRAALPTRDYGFGRMILDARHYTRLSPGARLNLRFWTSGWVSGDPLPIQRRLSLGGVDLLPGYRFRRFTCAPPGFSDPALPALCDRAFIVQAEFRSRFTLGLGWEYRDRDDRDLRRFIGIEEADLVVFSETGDAWLSGNGPGHVPNNRIPSVRDWKADVGAGIDAGGIGIYLVKALTHGEPLRCFVRLERRF